MGRVRSAPLPAPISFQDPKQTLSLAHLKVMSFFLSIFIKVVIVTCPEIYHQALNNTIEDDKDWTNHNGVQLVWSLFASTLALCCFSIHLQPLQNGVMIW